MNTKIRREIGRRTQRRRQAKGYTQEKMAELVGVSITTISRLETGERMVGVIKLMQIAEALGVTADALLYDPETKMPEADEWDERITCVLEECSSREKEYIWKMASEFLKLRSGESPQ